jgi:hypothetical protein
LLTRRCAVRDGEVVVEPASALLLDFDAGCVCEAFKGRHVLKRRKELRLQMSPSSPVGRVCAEGVTTALEELDKNKFALLVALVILLAARARRLGEKKDVCVGKSCHECTFGIAYTLLKFHQTLKKVLLFLFVVFGRGMLLHVDTEGLQSMLKSSELVVKLSPLKVGRGVCALIASSLLDLQEYVERQQLGHCFRLHCLLGLDRVNALCPSIHAAKRRWPRNLWRHGGQALDRRVHESTKSLWSFTRLSCEELFTRLTITRVRVDKEAKIAFSVECVLEHRRRCW